MCKDTVSLLINLQEIAFHVALEALGETNLNSLPNDKIVDSSKLRAFADNEMIVTQKLNFALGREENVLEKGENVDFEHFLLFPQCF